MLNRALRLQEVGTLIKFGFFLRDIHRQIEQIYLETKDKYRSLTIYRGQSMPKINFEKIQRNKGGLLAFNSFVSTSRDRNISLQFAEYALYNPEQIAVLFQITFDPTCTSTPFASLDHISFICSEQEILFSMHTVFRIGNTRLIQDRLWHIELTLTNDDDLQLRQLAERLREETAGATGWHRMGKLLLQMDYYDLAEDIYEKLLRNTSNDQWEERFHIYNQLGWIKYNKGDRRAALDYYQKDLEISRKLNSSANLDLGTTYSNIALVHKSMKDYSKALEYYEKAIHSYQNSSNPNYPDMASTYNCMGVLYYQLKDYPKALEFYEKTLEIRLKYLPSNHPNLATTYNNIGLLYKSLGDHSKARMFCEKAVSIGQNSLSKNHSRNQIYKDNLSNVENQF